MDDKQRASAWKPYTATRRSATGPCNICGTVAQLSWDHVPPQATGNRTKVGMIPLPARLSGVPGGARVSQDGIKFRSICRDCNAHLGHYYDPSMSAFARDIRPYATASIAVPRSIELGVKVQRVMKGVIGHLLASEVDYHSRSRFFQPWAKAYVLDHTVPLPERVGVYFWLQHGSGYLAITDLVKFSLVDHSMQTLHFLKFPPVGFLVTDARMYDGLPSLSRHRRAGGDDVVAVRVPLNAQRRQDWPEAPSDVDGTTSFVGANGFNAIYAEHLS